MEEQRSEQGTKHSFNKVLKQLFLAVVIIITTACARVDKPVVVVDNETYITQESDDLDVFYSELGHKSYRLGTEKLRRYDLSKEPYMDFPKGINIETYDSIEKPETWFTSKYAKFIESKKLWEARNEVVSRNIKGEIFETELLYWDQTTKKIYTDENIKITMKTAVLYGRGFVSDESMTNWEIKYPVGTVFINNINDSTSGGTIF